MLRDWYDRTDSDRIDTPPYFAYTGCIVFFVLFFIPLFTRHWMVTLRNFFFHSSGLPLWWWCAPPSSSSSSMILCRTSVLFFTNDSIIFYTYRINACGYSLILFSISLHCTKRQKKGLEWNEISSSIYKKNRMNEWKKLSQKKIIFIMLLSCVCVCVCMWCEVCRFFSLSLCSCFPNH